MIKFSVDDADTYKLLRKIGTTGHNHELTSPGDFSKPVGLAVDPDGNLYVADTMNNQDRGIRCGRCFYRNHTGKNGDGYGYFSRPKGVAIDGDGHIWVADGIQDRIQVFNKEWQLLIAFGGHGLLPGQFRALENIYIDKKNHVFTTEIYPGRAQEFQYISDAEADKERERRAAERANGAGDKKAADSQGQAPPPPPPAVDAAKPNP